MGLNDIIFILNKAFKKLDYYQNYHILFIECG